MGSRSTLIYKVRNNKEDISTSTLEAEVDMLPRNVDLRLPLT